MAEPIEPFFAGDDQVLKSYDFDYDKIIEFDNEVMCATVLMPCFWQFCCFIPCWRANNYDSARAQHLALTRDGIRFVYDKHPTSCRLSMCDEGRTSKTDKLTDCDIQEPAGTAVCCCVQNRLHVVTCDTASGTDLALRGLKDPEQFKRDVWAMKRGDGLMGVPDSVVATLMTRVDPGKKDAGGAVGSWFASGGGDGEAVPLLREQTALLKTAVSYLKTIAENSRK